MRIAVIGGTGLVGGHVVAALTRTGHDPVVVSRSTGADALTGEGLHDALAGADAVVDVANTPSLELDEVSQFFTTETRNVLQAESDLGIGHHVLLSIVGVDRVRTNPHYAAKLQQEQAASAGGVPLSILRATQFFEFAEMVVGWNREGDVTTIPPLLIQPAAAEDIAAELARLATGTPLDGMKELAGPRQEDLVDMTRRILGARGTRLEIRPAWHVGPFDTDMAGDALLPHDDATVTSTDLDAWLG